GLGIADRIDVADAQHPHVDFLREIRGIGPAADALIEESAQRDAVPCEQPLYQGLLGLRHAARTPRRLWTLWPSLQDTSPAAMFRVPPLRLLRCSAAVCRTELSGRARRPFRSRNIRDRKDRPTLPAASAAPPAVRGSADSRRGCRALQSARTSRNGCRPLRRAGWRGGPTRGRGLAAPIPGA